MLLSSHLLHFLYLFYTLLDLPKDGVMISQEEYSKITQIIADYEAGKLGGSSVEFEKVKGDEESNA
ncbi:hypothetical protein A3777_07100 [Enterococcus faecalis]|nr:hypothetical protein A3777_07100 [Enterococcus faecalis]